MKLAPFQRQFVEGALDPATNIAVLSIGRGGAKTALASGIALGALLGTWDNQPRREILIAARTRDQAKIAWDFVAGFAESLPDEVQNALIYRRSPRLEIEYEGDGGGHVLRAIAADGRSALGSAPTLILMGERGQWNTDKGDALEHALLSGLGKRGGRALIISTSAADDAHPFSRWIDDPQPGTYVQEHRPAPGLPADDRDSLLIANPGAAHGIGAGIEWLEAEARRSIARGGAALTAFRLYNRNERISGETRDLLLTVDECMACEVADLPPKNGPLVLGIDLLGFTWGDFDGDTLRLVQGKTDVSLVLPCTDELKAALIRHKAALPYAPHPAQPILASPEGSKMTYRQLAPIFMRDRKRLGLEAHDMHALRYRGVAELAWAGCTDEEIASYSGHMTLAMVKKYAGPARQIMRARQAKEKRQ